MGDRLTIVPPPQGAYLGQHEVEPGDIATFEEAIGRRVPLWSPLQVRAFPFAPGALHTGATFVEPRLDVVAAREAWEEGRPIRVSAYEACPGPTGVAAIPDRHPHGFTIDRLCRGQYDRQLATLAADFRACGRPMWFETLREPNGILADWFGGFGPDGDKPLAWAIANECATGGFQPGSLPNAELYEGLDDPDIPDGLRRTSAAHRYYVDFFVRREGCQSLTFHTNGWSTMMSIADKVDAQPSPYGKAIAERLWQFGNGYPGDRFVDWVTLTLHMIDWRAADWPARTEDQLVPTELYLDHFDQQMVLVRAAAPDVPVMIIELGFPDRQTDSERSAERITAFYEHARRYPEIRAFCHWADSSLWADSWPFDSLIRPHTHQAAALRSVIAEDPARFASVIHLSDGTTFPTADGM